MTVHGLFSGRQTLPLPFYDEKTGKIVAGGTTFADTVNCATTCAPYLRRLIDTHPDILTGLEYKTPEKIIADVFMATDCDEIKPLKASLRLAKKKVHLVCALCDLAGIWGWKTVTATLSDFADLAMNCLVSAVAKEMEFETGDRGPIPGLFVTALGKYGARELNYSSDIDLIVFYDPDHIVFPNPEKRERMLIRFVQRLMRGFDEVTEHGYVFRTDLRLRPDPRSNSVAVSTVTAERYYESLGQNWERAAMIKARYCGGDRQAADEFFKSIISPYVWRRNLDYAAIADIHSIKRQVQGNASIPAGGIEEYDLKLGIGGIREIEFFAQTQQLILGGRHPALRMSGTVDALQALGAHKYADLKTIAMLVGNYGRLRGLEHRLQMYGDEQTHTWPAENTRRKKIAALTGYLSSGELETDLTDLFRCVHTAYVDLFPGEEDLSTEKGNLVFTGVELEPATKKTLKAYGYERGGEIWQHMADWLGGRIRATRTPRARELLTRLVPHIIEHCAETGEPDVAFFAFGDFLTRLNAGVTLLSLFVSKPKTLQQLIDMLVLAPPLVEFLSAQPALIDAITEPDFLTRSQYQNRMSLQHVPIGDYESALNLTRRMVHEEQLSVIAGLLNLQNLEAAGEHFTGIAGNSMGILLPFAREQIEARYGTLDGEYAVIGLGKLGGREMTLNSDLDIMVVFQGKARNEAVDQDRFTKFTRRFISALSSMTEEGGLYEVDMALRPSGRSGTIAISIDAFKSYYTKDAWTWEFMALTRARVITGSSADFCQKIEKSIVRILRDKDFGDQLLPDVLDMHDRLRREKPAKGRWDIKSTEGGLRDIEFIAQYLMLRSEKEQLCQSTRNQVEQARSHGHISQTETHTLLAALTFYQGLMQLITVCADSAVDVQTSAAPVRHLLARSIGVLDVSELEKTYRMHKEAVSGVFRSILLEPC